jgi:isocitrate dehydrogenase
MKINKLKKTIPNLFKYNKFNFSENSKILKSPPLVYISGEEMSRYAGELYLDNWIRPYMDISNWKFYDLSCKSRDNSNDQVLRDCIAEGAKIGAIYKEPTITPNAQQKIEFGLKNTLPSPNGIMRAGWNGITISRDTIHIPGMNLGYKNPVLFDRHAVGGEYGAGAKIVGAGKAITLFTPKNNTSPTIVVDERVLKDNINAAVFYHNPYDNVPAMARHFFGRCLEANVVPYVVTKKTVFKWQEEFWRGMKEVFDSEFKAKYNEKGLLKSCRGELQHFLSDVATMNLIRWSEGNFGMCAHNYDGDVLTDEIAQIHRSPGFLSSVLNGVRDDGSIIKEFEASHGTVTDMWIAHLKGKETSLNPLSMMEALIGSIRHSVKLSKNQYQAEDIMNFMAKLQDSIYKQMTTEGKATRDLSGPEGLTTEEFVKAVKERIDGIHSQRHVPVKKIINPVDDFEDAVVDIEKVRRLFNEIDVDKNGLIDIKEFTRGLKVLRISPKKIDRILEEYPKAF